MLPDGATLAVMLVVVPVALTVLLSMIAADTAPNTETIALADLSLSDLLTARQSGAVQNLKDRRFDLYSVSWKKDG